MNPSTPKKKITLKPYCENVAFLKCPNCHNCIPLQVEETNVSSSKGSDWERSAAIPNLSPILRKIRGEEESPQTEMKMDIRPVGPSPEGNRGNEGADLPSPRASTPVHPVGLSHSHQGETSIYATPERDINLADADPFIGERVRTSPGMQDIRNINTTKPVELRQNPISRPDDIPFVSPRHNELRIRNAESLGFETENSDIAWLIPSSQNNDGDGLQQRWRECDNEFRETMSNLLPRFETMTNMLRSITNEANRRQRL